MFYKKVGIESTGVSSDDTLQKFAQKTFHRDDIGDSQKGKAQHLHIKILTIVIFFFFLKE
jgi:hypothetical protein